MRFYDEDGIVSGAGIVRARENGFVPSVTTILDVLAKPGVEYWKRSTLMDVCYSIFYI